ncbi:MAG: 2Fe-2S iron-sulfur cluster binding domain-containing protein, partial [Deltaproteobacteria bacterium]|nr:2Fe-2S iron-sulfur cluster binding domain-containing protein [Deltaproteobacteria bacterium]
MSRKISFTFNGNPIKMVIEDHWTLLHLIREELGYTGTKEGCGSGECGACTVIVDDKAVNSCLYLAAEIDGKQLTTIEGLAAADGTLHPIQKSFVE